MKGAGVEPACDWRPSWQTVNANPLEAPIGHRVGGAYEWALNVVRTGFEPVIFWLRTRCLGPTRRTDQETRLSEPSRVCSPSSDVRWSERFTDQLHPRFLRRAVCLAAVARLARAYLVRPR